MIIRILGEGQYTVDPAEMDELNRLDGLLLEAADDGDDGAFTEILSQLRESVRSAGTPLDDEELVGSDLVLPATDTDLAQVRAMLGDEGLIPG